MYYDINNVLINSIKCTMGLLFGTSKPVIKITEKNKRVRLLKKKIKNKINDGILKLLGIIQ